METWLGVNDLLGGVGLWVVWGGVGWCGGRDRDEILVGNVLRVIIGEKVEVEWGGVERVR